MKARIKGTGETIEVTETFIGERTYRDIHGNRYFKDDLEIEDSIDWEQRRYEIAKDVLCAIKAHEDTGLYGGDKKEMSEYAVGLADALVSTLKEHQL